MIKLEIKIQTPDTMITESAQIDTAKPMPENSRDATPAKNSPEQNEETMDEKSATQSRSKIDKMNGKKQQPFESSEESSKPKAISSSDKIEHRESKDTTQKKDRSSRKSNVRSSSESDDEEMEQGNKNSNKKGKSPTDRKIRTPPKETLKKQSREKSSDTSEKHSKSKSREHSRDISREHSRDNSKERSRKRLREEQSDEESGSHSKGRNYKRHHSQSGSPGKEKAIKSHGNNSSQSPQKFQETVDNAKAKKTSHEQKNENNITTPQKKGDAKKARISPILFDEPNNAEASGSWRKEDSLKLLKQNWKFDKKEHFYFFFGKDVPFSNFHPARFTVDGETYTCSEQFMMHRKAGEIINCSPQHCKGNFYY